MFKREFLIYKGELPVDDKIYIPLFGGHITPVRSGNTPRGSPKNPWVSREPRGEL